MLPESVFFRLTTTNSSVLSVSTSSECRACVDRDMFLFSVDVGEVVRLDGGEDQRPRDAPAVTTTEPAAAAGAFPAVAVVESTSPPLLGLAVVPAGDVALAAPAANHNITTFTGENRRRITMLFVTYTTYRGPNVSSGTKGRINEGRNAYNIIIAHALCGGTCAARTSPARTQRHAEHNAEKGTDLVEVTDNNNITECGPRWKEWTAGNSSSSSSSSSSEE